MSGYFETRHNPIQACKAIHQYYDSSVALKRKENIHIWMKLAEIEECESTTLSEHKHNATTQFPRMGETQDVQPYVFLRL
jgi:hypothetical protein